jgi:hypothetical protein
LKEKKTIAKVLGQSVEKLKSFLVFELCLFFLPMVSPASLRVAYACPALQFSWE